MDVVVDKVADVVVDKVVVVGVDMGVDVVVGEDVVGLPRGILVLAVDKVVMEVEKMMMTAGQRLLPMLTCDLSARKWVHQSHLERQRTHSWHSSRTTYWTT